MWLQKAKLQRILGKIKRGNMGNSENLAPLIVPLIVPVILYIVVGIYMAMDFLQACFNKQSFISYGDICISVFIFIINPLIIALVFVVFLGEFLKKPVFKKRTSHEG